MENIIKCIIILIMLFLIGWDIGTTVALDYYKRKYVVAAPYQEYCETFWKEKEKKEFNAWKEMEGKYNE